MTTISGGLAVTISPCGDGKTGPRTLTCFPEAVQIIDELKELLKEFCLSTDAHAYLFQSRRINQGEPIGNLNGFFRQIVAKFEWSNLRSQSLYSCRHTHITYLLKTNCPIKTISENCGTSMEMIERFYSHVQGKDVMSDIFRYGFSSQLQNISP